MKYKFEAEVTAALRDYPQQLAASPLFPLRGSVEPVFLFVKP